jgi:hypothetical protein
VPLIGTVLLVGLIVLAHAVVMVCGRRNGALALLRRRG